MKKLISSMLFFISFQLVFSQKPIVDEKVVFGERAGVIVVEAEYFIKQTKNSIRQWYINSPKLTPPALADSDGKNLVGASNVSYIEALPDECVFLTDKVVEGVNTANAPGRIAEVFYRIYFDKPGRYYIWTRIRSNTEQDNTLHVGIDSSWPVTGNTLQFQGGTGYWTWNNRVRSDVPEPFGDGNLAFLDVTSAGEHIVMFSMRQDGIDFDKFILTKNRDFIMPEGEGPKNTLRSGRLPKIE